MNISLALHIIGIVGWMGGMLILTRVMTLLAGDLKDRGAVVSMCKRLYFGWCIGGLALASGTGIAQIAIRGMKFYMQQGWFHGKLTFLLLLIAVTVAVGVQLSRAARGEALKRKTVMTLHGLTGISMIAIVLLTFLGR